ncbi:MAG: ABC transporter ATP-binding protein [Acidilobaceae archaeon]
MALLSIDGLSVYYYTLSGIVRAVDNVSLNVEPGEWVSIVGESGSGKSTLGFSITRLTPPPGRIVGGSIVFNGVDIVKAPDSVLRKIRGREISMIFQDPMTSLDPLRTVGSQLKEVIEDHGVSHGREAEDMAKRSLISVGLSGDTFYSYPHQLSGGQRQRVAIARALIVKPDFIVADEPVSMLDVSIRASILGILETFKRELSLSTLFITHDLAVARLIGDKIAIMYLGKIVEEGFVEEVLETPLHPYTKALTDSIPSIRKREKGKLRLKDVTPDPVNPPEGCRLHPRCPFATEECRLREPKLETIKGRKVACHYPLQ